MPAEAGIDGWPRCGRGRRATPAASVAGHGRDEVGDLFGFLALVEQRGHLPEAAGAAFGDRVQHERLAPRRTSRCLRPPAHRGSGPYARRLGRCERVADAHVCGRTVRGLSSRRPSGARRRRRRSPCALCCRPARAPAPRARKRPARRPTGSPAGARAWIPCAGTRARLGPPRIATKNTPRPSRAQKRTITMTMPGKISGERPERPTDGRRDPGESSHTFIEPQAPALLCGVRQTVEKGFSAVNILRRLPLSRLLLLCGVVVAAGISITALASALSAGPTPAPKPLAQAVHDALAAPPVTGRQRERHADQPPARRRRTSRAAAAGAAAHLQPPR